MSRPAENYPDALVRLVVNMVEGTGKDAAVRPIAPKRIAQFDGAPSERTIRGWRKKYRSSESSSTEISARGRPPLLSEPEKFITGGWAIARVKAGKIVSIRHVKAFILVGEPILVNALDHLHCSQQAQEAFGVEVDDPYVSNLMKELSFSSRMSRSVQAYRLQPQFEDELVSFLRRVRAVIKDVHDLSRVMAIDQIGLWNSPSVLRSYAPIGW